MEARAIQRYAKLSPQKARLVVDLVRGRKVEDALGMLAHLPKKGAKILAKVIRSAVANAEHAQRVDVDDLYISKVFVDGGPTSNRFLPRAHGRATPLIKRTSHITVIVDEKSSRGQG